MNPPITFTAPCPCGCPCGCPAAWTAQIQYEPLPQPLRDAPFPRQLGIHYAVDCDCEYCEEGHPMTSPTALTPRPGDFFLTRTRGWQAALIRFGTRSAYNHAGIFLGKGWDAQVVEAQPHGSRISHAPDPARSVVSTGRLALTSDDRDHIRAAAVELVGVPYSWADIVSVGLLQYGIKPRWLRRRVAASHNLICSQLVDQAYLMAGIHLFDDGRVPSDCTPGDLAKLAGLR